MREVIRVYPPYVTLANEFPAKDHVTLWIKLHSLGRQRLNFNVEFDEENEVSNPPR